MYTTKDYGLLFLGVDQDVYSKTNKTSKQNTIYSTSHTMDGWYENTFNVGKGNPNSEQHV